MSGGLDVEVDAYADVEGKQLAEAVAVVVPISQSDGQAVWQGRNEVRVGVIGQAAAGPGIVVVFMIMHAGTMQGFPGGAWKTGQ